MTAPQRGAKVARPSKKTDELILDTAERLFATDGLGAVSLRRIAQEAKVDAASITYHFGNKDSVVEAVVARRVGTMNDARLEALADVLDRTRNRPSIEDVLDALFRPWLDLYLSGDEGWRHYSRVTARMLMVPRLAEMYDRHMRRVEVPFLNAMRLAAPEADDRNLYWAVGFAVGSAVFLFSETPRLDLYSRGRCSSKDTRAGYDRLLRFISAGVEATANSPFPEDLLPPPTSKRKTANRP